MPSETTGWSSDRALRAMFVEESFQRIARLHDAASRLSTGEVDLALVDELLREAHTVKGGASVVGLGDLAELGAEIEAILTAVRDGRLGVSDMLLDDLRDAISELRETHREVATTRHDSTSADASAARSSTATVLVVDDDELILELLRRMLDGTRWSVVTANAAGDAVGVLSNRPVDLVITDLEMPGDDGSALLQRIRSDPSTKDIPVVVLSALRDGDDGSELLASGADAVLSKSGLDRARLAAVVERLVPR